ncbi:hypothetical protein CsSME_00021927 [Camellia sinensis var. sinensis]
MAPWPPYSLSLSLSLHLLSSHTSSLSFSSHHHHHHHHHLPNPIPLDPKQLTALQSLNIPTSTVPCSQPPSLHSATVCHAAKLFPPSSCSTDLSLFITALSSLSSLTSFQFFNSPLFLKQI